MLCSTNFNQKFLSDLEKSDRNCQKINFMREKENYISFNTINFNQLKKIVNIQEVDFEEKFNDWFNFSYLISDEETYFLKNLISKNKFFISSFSEDELKAEFLIPLLNRVSFWVNNKRAWYSRPLSAKINNVEIGGFADFMVACGDENPEKPYFFIQEFKREGKTVHPKNQLLAEMIVATELNKTIFFCGAYITGREWHFVILEKNVDNSFQYYISRTFDSMYFPNLSQIFINLQFIKESLKN